MRVALVLLFLLGFAAPAGASSGFSIGSGALTGNYKGVAEAICRHVAESGATDRPCEARISEGSVANARALAAGEAEFALVQSDVLADALAGRDAFAGAPAPTLRAVVGLHVEQLTILARAGAGLGTLEALKAKRVNFPSGGSGHRASFEKLMAEFGWTRRDFRLVARKPVLSDGLELCDGSYDALVYVIGHPSRTLANIAERCAIALVPVEGPQVDALIKGHPAYVRSAIPAGLYGNAAAVASVGVRAVLATSAAQPDALVAAVTKALLEDLDGFRRRHPVLERLERDALAAGVAAPLHPAAQWLLQEAGVFR
jgi:TRAP transporter TAXI family solute receptor